MASSTPTSKPGQQTPAKAGSLPGRKMPWWQRWVEPILAVTIIAALLTALVTGGSMAFQSLKGDIQASEARISARIDRLAVRIGTVEVRLHEEIQAGEARQSQQVVELKEEIQVSEVRQNQRIDELRQDNAEFKQELKEEVQASEARQNQRIDEAQEEVKGVKTELRAMDNKLDRVLEALLAAKA